MSAFTDDELEAIGDADELRVAGLKTDGTLRKFVTIWAVRAGDAIFIRSVNGPDAAWFRGTQIRDQGQIRSGGVTKDVDFERDVDHDDAIDKAYADKYGRGSSAVRAITGDLAIGTTLRVAPR